MVALATILAISVASEGYMDQRRTSTVMVMDQAFEIALGAEALAADVISRDNPKIDTLDEDWAQQPPPMPIDEGIGEFKGNLEDLQGRFNLNNLLKTDGSPNPTMVRQFQRLLELLGIDVRFATLTLDWIDADSNPDPLDGAEDAIYAGQTPPYLTANIAITRSSELMSLVGMKQADYLRLEPYITALPVGTPLNTCTASAWVLDSLSSTIQQYSKDLVSFAKIRSQGGCFPTKANVTTSFNSDPDFNKLVPTNPNYLGQTTNYFRANILVTIGTTELALYSVLSRVSNGNQSKTHVIQRSIGTT
jgi:general secretion pathway protein K